MFVTLEKANSSKNVIIKKTKTNENRFIRTTERNLVKEESKTNDSSTRNPTKIKRKLTSIVRSYH